MIEEAEDRAKFVALIAAVLSSRYRDGELNPKTSVGEARELIIEAYAAEGRPSPFPAAEPQRSPGS